MRRHFRFSIGTLFGLTLLVAVSALLVSKSSYKMHEDLTYWPKDILEILPGRQIAIFSVADNNLIEYASSAVITDVIINQDALDEISVQLPLWQKLRIMRTDQSELAWIDYGLTRGGAVQR